MADEQRNEQRNDPRDDKGADRESQFPKSAGRAERGAPEHAAKLPEQDPQGDTMRPHGDELREKITGDDAQRDVLP